MDSSSSDWKESVRKRLIFLGHLPGSVEQFRIITVEQILAKKRSISHFEEGSCSDSDVLGAKGYAVLVGSLISALGKVSCRDYHLLPSDLVFSDSTGQIPCFVANISPSMTDRMVIIIRWSYIKLPSGLQYLEIGRMQPLNSGPKETFRSQLFTFVPRDAGFLQANRHILDGRLINIIGFVSAISHPMRYRNAVIFLIQFKDSKMNHRVVVLNRDMKKIYWHLLVRPLQEYVITNLQPTTLSFGQKKIGILLITDDSKCFLASEVSDRIQITKIECYLKNHGFAEELFLSWKRDRESEGLRVHPLDFNIINFKGTVTSTELSHLGIFELDKTIKLHLNKMADVKRFQHLRVNTRVTLFNVHLSKSKHESYKAIHCCWYGCVRVDRFSKQLPSVDNSESTISDMNLKSLLPVMAPLLSDCGLPFVNFDLLLESATTLRKQFCPKIIKSLDFRFLRHVFHGNRPETNRRPILEFLSDDHSLTCGFSAKSAKANAFRVSTVSDLRNIFQNLDDKTKDKLVTAEEPCWNCQIISSSNLPIKWVVVGALRCGSQTAQLQLFDQTGSIDCVIVNALEASKTVSDLHECMDGDCCKFEEVRYPFQPLCPFPQTWSIGSLFRLSDFRVVKETFFQPPVSPDCPGVSSVCIYVEFSLRDTLCLRKLDTLHPSYKWHNPNDKETSRTEKIPKLSTVGCSQRFKEDIREKTHPQSILSSFTQKELQKKEQPKSPCSCFVTRKFLLYHKHSIRTRNTLPGVADLSFTTDVLLFGDIYVFNCGCKTAAKAFTQNSSKNSAPERQVSLLFQNKSALWYPVLHVGCVYCLTIYGLDDSKILDGGALSAELQKFGARLEISLAWNVRVDRIFPVLNDCSGNYHLPERLHLSDLEHLMVRPLIDNLKKTTCKMIEENTENSVTADGKNRSFFSFKGVIIIRGLKEQQDNVFGPRNGLNVLPKKGVSKARGLDLWLVVKELSTFEEHQVYMSLSQMPCPLGLFVGSVVHLKKLERCISRKENQYFRFLFISSCTLLSFSWISWKDLSWNSDGVLRSEPKTISKFVRNDRSRVFLHDLMSASLNSSNIVSIDCEITKIVHFSMEFGCAGHGVVCVDDSGKCFRCQDSTRFKAFASFRIEDGTGVAVVNCYGNHVPELLNFKADEWEQLKILVGKSGGFSGYLRGDTFDLQSGSSSEVALLIGAICSSSTVLRPVVFQAKLCNPLLRSGAKTFKNIEEMCLSDFDVQHILRSDGKVAGMIKAPDIQLEYVSLSDFKFSNSVKLTTS